MLTVQRLFVVVFVAAVVALSLNVKGESDMATLNDLVGQIDNAAFRERIEEEIKRVVKQKKFGLVFEEHLPECTPLWENPVKRGSLVAKKRKGVKVTIITSEHYDKKHVPHRKISDADIATFNAQYPRLAVRYNETFHDRFLIVDDKELYLIGASLKDLGKKCFGFTKMDAGEIARIKKVAFVVGVRTRA